MLILAGLHVGHSINGAMRSLFIGHLLKPILDIINMVYKTIMSIAQTPIISGEVVYEIFNKVQLILAVFMVFRIMVTVLQMIISPDSGKNESGNAKGGTKFTIILKRILLGLILLVLLRPVNISVTGTGGQRQLNEYVANHGIIFGILYDLQYRILENNNIACLISTKDSKICGTSLDESEDQTTKFTDYLVTSFVHPNTDEQCDPDSPDLAKYKNGQMTAEELLSKDVYKQDCSDDEDEFLFEYNYVILFAGAGIVLYILIGFLIDVAIRSIKLSILRLISPIPVISYMANEKDQILNNWAKNLINTYVDLFVRLAIIFLAFSLLGQMFDGQSYLSDDQIGVFTKVVISIALLIFVKIAPKYIMDILGIKSTGANTLGLSALMGGTARVLGGGGASGFAAGALSTLDSSTDAISQGKAAPGAGNAFRQNADLQARIRTGDKEAHGGLSGKLLDRMNFQNRERAADKLGIGSKDYAKASYVNDINKKDMKAAEEEMNEAESALSKFQKNGNKMTMQQLANEYGLSGDDLRSTYSQYSSQYDAAAKRVNEAKAKYKTASDAYAKSNKNVERMDKERQAMNVLPRIIDTEKDHSPKQLPGKAGELQEKFLENTKVGQVYTAARDSKAVGAVKDFVYYREPEQVVTNDNGLAVNSAGEATQKESEYQYKRNNKGYQGAVDETTFININGGPPGPPPGS